MKKTFKQWEKSELDFDKFAPIPCEVDEETYMYFLEILPPQYSYMSIFQVGEAIYSKGDNWYYSTFSQVGDKYFYLGVLPKFKQPKL